MKNLLLLLICIPFVAYSQTFELTLSDYYQQITTDVIELDSCYVFAVRVNNDDGKTFSTIVTVDKKGRVLKSRPFKDNRFELIHNLATINDSCFFAFHYFTSNNIPDSSCFKYYVMDRNLEIIKETNINLYVPKSSDSIPVVIDSKLAINSNGTITHVFGYQGIKQGFTNAFLINNIEIATLSMDQNNYSRIDDYTLPQCIVEYSKDTSLLFLENNTYKVVNSSIIDTMPENFLTYNSEHEISTISKNISTTIMNGKLYVGGGVGKIYTAAFESDIQIVNFYSFGELGLDARYAAYNKCISSNNNNLFVGGTKDYSSFLFGTESSLCIAKMKDDLSIQWENYYKEDDGYYYFAFNILATNDGGCLIVSTQNNIETLGDTLNTYILKVDSKGFYSPVNISRNDFYNCEHKLYPNPGSNYLRIEVDQEYTISVFNLYNIHGQKVLSEQLLKNNSQINTNSLQNGMYIYTVKNNKGVIIRGKWIKR